MLICSIIFGVTFCKICALILLAPGAFFFLRLIILALTSLAVTRGIREFPQSFEIYSFFLLKFFYVLVNVKFYYSFIFLIYLLVEFWRFLANAVLRLLDLFLFCCFDLWLFCLLTAARIGWTNFCLHRSLALDLSI